MGSKLKKPKRKCVTVICVRVSDMFEPEPGSTVGKCVECHTSVWLDKSLRDFENQAIKSKHFHYTCLSCYQVPSTSSEVTAVTAHESQDILHSLGQDETGEFSQEVFFEKVKVLKKSILN